VGLVISRARLLPQRDRAAERARRVLGRLANQSQELLQAHYQDTVPLDLLRKEQARIAVERASAEQALAEAEVQREQLEGGLKWALDVLRYAHDQYLASRPCRA